MNVIGPVQSHYHEGSSVQVGKRNLRWEGFDMLCIIYKCRHVQQPQEVAKYTYFPHIHYTIPYHTIPYHLGRRGPDSPGLTLRPIVTH